MINLEKFFLILFDDEKIIDEKLRGFIEDHLQRLSVNNTANQYDTLITDMLLAYNNYFGAITNEDTNFAIQQGRTISVDNIIKDFKQTVSQREGLVRNSFKVGSAQYEEFLPLGLTEYSNATKTNIETLMTRLVNAFTTHQGVLGAAPVTEFTNLKQNYLLARGDQLSKIGQVTADKSATSTSRDGVERQAMIDLLTLAIEFVGNPARGMDFFDQSIIRPAESTDSDGKGQAEGIITGGTPANPLQKVLVEVITANVPNRNTKIDGSFRTNKIPIGMHKFRCTKPGWVTQEITREVKDQGMTLLNVLMVAAP